MRVVVTGATGNVGTSVLAALGADPAVDSILGLARRIPAWRPPKVEWARADVRDEGLERLFAGAGAVVHLAWLIQPSRDQDLLESVNVEGSRRVFAAAAAAGAGALVYASSVGAYSAGPEDEAVDESWPTEGIPASFYSRHKAATELLLDRCAETNPELRVVRLRPGLIFKRPSGSEIARYFAGPFLPRSLLRPRLLPVVPGVRGLRFQAVHADDVGEAYRLAVTSSARGAFNIAAPPVLDSEAVARVLGGRSLRLPPAVARGAAAISWRGRLQPTPPGWVDLALGSPVMDTRRAEAELGWRPRVSSAEALAELLAGIRSSDGMDTPPLRPGR
ncbi:MAG TPA: NAD-dependent epimerase/dehydratase family protein [Solirubrobacterales bacterium]|nr:NAD-dependent epimerase/dehydratase family protein [Solirubrobacterales bacterium]